MKKVLLSVLACGYLVAGINDGLVAHYEFEGNANDSSGNGNNGTEYGGVEYVDGVMGKAGSLFNTSITNKSQYISMNFQQNLSNPFSYVLYANFKELAHEQGESIISCGVDTTEEFFSLWINKDGKLSIGYGNSNNILIEEEVVLTKNKFENIGLIYDGNDISVYLNASLESKVKIINP